MDKTIITDLIQFRKEHELELANILEWWMENMIDSNHEGFYGSCNNCNEVDPEAEKGLILNTRILWTFSAAYNQTRETRYRKVAERSYRYITENFIDHKNGGLYWMLSNLGDVIESKKQSYGLAFAVYGFSEYYEMTKDIGALKHAMDTFECIENHSYDAVNGGYLEAFTVDWKTIEDRRLSKKDLNAAKTMNTHLHIMEAYSNLYRIHPDHKVKLALKKLINCFLTKFINRRNFHLNLYFDELWKSQSSDISYGHDIEASWLLLEAAEILGDNIILEKVKDLVAPMALSVLDEGVEADGGMYYELKYNDNNTHLEREKHWWVQAEAVIGFYNAYQVAQNDVFLNASINSWTFIKNSILDSKYGEWKWSNTDQNQNEKAGPWKAPYHNARMCMEVIKRVNAT